MPNGHDDDGPKDLSECAHCRTRLPSWQLRKEWSPHSGKALVCTRCSEHWRAGRIGPSSPDGVNGCTCLKRSALPGEPHLPNCPALLPVERVRLGDTKIAPAPYVACPPSVAPSTEQLRNADDETFAKLMRERRKHHVGSKR